MPWSDLIRLLRCYRALPFLAFLSGVTGLQSQGIVEGSLRDSLGYPVPYAQVQGRRDAGLPWAIMGFTDSLGLFRLAPGQTHSLALRFTALGYLQQDTLLTRGKEGRCPPLSLVMPEAPVTLQEVVLQGDQALRIRPDTI